VCLEGGGRRDAPIVNVACVNGEIIFVVTVFCSIGLISSVLAGESNTLNTRSAAGASASGWYDITCVVKPAP
jgi:hypothetical protein